MSKPTEFRCFLPHFACLLAISLAGGCKPTSSSPTPSSKRLPTITQTFGEVSPIEGEPESFENSVGMTLVRIAPGEFTAGWPDPDSPDFEEFGGPQHVVAITRPFYMAAHEVTQTQYEAVMGENPSRNISDSSEPNVAEKLEGVDTSNFPVEKVSWEEAMEFCRKLSELPDEKAAGRVYTLPTEAQWEYACRAGADTLYSTGDEIGVDQAAFVVSETGQMPAATQPVPVGTFPPNAWGLYDMHGNVQEWCIDAMREYGTERVEDPTSEAGDATDRMLRGGAFRLPPGNARAGYRNHYGKTSRQDNIGFRVIIQQ